MLSRDRVFAALEFRPPDVPPLQISPAPGGLHEHGQKLLDRIKTSGDDFNDLGGLKLPDPPRPEDFDPDGRYHAIRTNGWGTTWEYRIFGVWGHPIAYPLADLAKLDELQIPSAPPVDDPARLAQARADAARHRQRWFHLADGGGLFEKMFSLRPFEDVVVEVYQDAPQINRLADTLVERIEGFVRWALAIDADGIHFYDDFGTQRDLIFPRPVWRRFFKTRYARLFEPIRRAGKKIFFHSCGQIGPILEDLAEIGVNAIWPQLPAFDLPALARQCRPLRLAVQLHPDRGDLMQRHPPAAVRDYVRRLVDVFGTRAGGSWLYIEIDPGFAWPNVKALFDTAQDLRRGA